MYSLSQWSLKYALKSSNQIKVNIILSLIFLSVGYWCKSPVKRKFYRLDILKETTHERYWLKSLLSKDFKSPFYQNWVINGRCYSDGVFYV